MEVASSSVNSTIRDSVSAGRGLLWFVAATIVPQSCPSTTIGEATAERTPSTFAMAATEPVALSQSSMRAACPVRCTEATMFSPSSVRRGAQWGRVPRSLRLRDERGGPVGLEPKHPDGVHLQDPRRLFGDRFEDLHRR